MTYEFHDLTTPMAVGETKKIARHIIMDDLIEYLKTKYEDIEQVAENEFGVIVGEAKDEDGYSADVCVTIKCSCKPWYNKNEGKRGVKKYELADMAEEYRLEVKASKIPKK